MWLKVLGKVGPKQATKKLNRYEKMGTKTPILKFFFFPQSQIRQSIVTDVSKWENDSTTLRNYFPPSFSPVVHLLSIVAHRTEEIHTGHPLLHVQFLHGLAVALSRVFSLKKRHTKSNNSDKLKFAPILKQKTPRIISWSLHPICNS